MNTLSNVHRPSYSGFASRVSPEAQGSQTGVSVEYATDRGKHWFVLRATYNRAGKAYDYIVNDHTEAYLPMHYIDQYKNGKKKRVLVPLLPQMVFVYATFETMERYVRQTPALNFLNYYYNHYSTGRDGKNPPLIINKSDMDNFIRITSVCNDHVRVVTPSECHYKRGELVKVVGGDFAGVVGKVARVAGQQRVVVTIEGLCSLATAYIPRAFIQVIS